MIAGLYVLLATVAIVPLSFWPSQYFALDAVKTLVIAAGTLISAVLLLIPAARSARIELPPKSIVWTSVLVILSLVVSSIAGGHFMKSFFGQGFESMAGSFLAVLFVSGLLSYAVVRAKPSRAMALYAAIIAPFLVLFIVHGLRFIFGAGFLSFSILGNLTSTVLGNWYALAAYGIAVTVISTLAAVMLPLSRPMRSAYWISAVAGLASAFVVNDHRVWFASVLVFAGLSIYMYAVRPRPEGSAAKAIFKRLAWAPLLILAFSGLMLWRGDSIAGPVISRMGAGYSEVVLPWQMTVDVIAGELKSAPLLGSGPNRFAQAYMAYKPADVNQTDAWSIEFSSGFGLIPTFAVTQGMIGLTLWVLLLVFLGISGSKSLKSRMGSSDGRDGGPYASFLILSSFSSAALIWISSVVSVPAQPILFLGAVLTGIWLGSAVSFGALEPFAIDAAPGSRLSKAVKPAVIIAAVTAGLWCLVFVRDSAALGFFDAGVAKLTGGSDPVAADSDFKMALTIYPLDVYWQGRAEAAITMARTAASSVTAGSSASTTEEKAAIVSGDIKDALAYAENAVSSDPDNYYNYVSVARVGEAAASVGMSDGWKTAIDAYDQAIRIDPGNPALYVSLANDQASANQLDAALQTLGTALQVKQNYLDAVYLLSQIEAAKGNLADAVTAAKFAISLNAGNPLLYFQLGLLQYAQGTYSDAATSLSEAIKLSPDYANAAYYLGLADARLGKNDQAISIFESLAKSNPDNADVSSILQSLRSGKSPFVTGAAGTASSSKSKTPPVK